jgi:hypothetical protein
MSDEATRTKGAGRALLAALGLFVAGALGGGAAFQKLHAAPPPVAALQRRQSAPAEPPRAKRSAEAILAEFKANPSPGFALDMEAEEFDQLLRERLGKQCELAWELWQDHPTHREVDRLLFARWMNLLNFFAEPAKVRAETASVLDTRPAARLGSLALFVRAQAAIADPALTREEIVVDVERAVNCGREPRSYPGWAGGLLVDLAIRRTVDPRLQRELLERSRERVGSEDGTSSATELEALIDHVGAPFPIDFTDALTQRPVDLRALRGKPYLVRLWSATSPNAKRELAQVDVLSEELRRLGAPIVSIEPWTAPDQIEATRKAVQDFGVAEPCFADAGELDATWAWRLGLRGTPWYLWIDGAGRLAGVAQSAAAFRGELARLGRKPQ